MYGKNANYVSKCLISNGSLLLLLLVVALFKSMYVCMYTNLNKFGKHYKNIKQKKTKQYLEIY